METRTQVEYHVYGLLLNPIRGRMENLKLVALAGSQEALLTYHNFFRVEPYYDKNSGISDDYGNPRTWRKYFKIESPLEWFNPLEDGGEIVDRWLTAEAFRRLIQKVPIIDGSYVP